MIPFYLDNGNPITDKAAAPPGSEYVHIHFGTSYKIIALSVATNNIQYPRVLFYIKYRGWYFRCFHLSIAEPFNIKFHDICKKYNNFLFNVIEVYRTAYFYW